MKKQKGKSILWENGKQKNEVLVEVCVLNNKIVYKEKDILVKIKEEEKGIKVERKHKDYEIELFFKEKEKTKGKYCLKEVNNILDIEIISKKVKKEKGKLEIEYELSIGKEKKHYLWNLLCEVIQ